MGPKKGCRNYSKEKKKREKEIKKTNDICLVWEREGEEFRTGEVCLTAYSLGETKKITKANPNIPNIYITGKKATCIFQFLHWYYIKNGLKGKIFWVDPKSSDVWQINLD